MYCLKCDSTSQENQPACEKCGEPFHTDADKYFKAGMEALSAGDILRAIELLRNCVMVNPAHVNGRYNLGMALALVDKCDEAMQQYEKILETDPDYPGIYTALGQAAFGGYLLHSEAAEYRHRAMIHFFMRAMEQDPDDVDAYFSLANAYLAVGSADKAVPWLKGAMRLHPDSPAIYFTLAKALQMTGDYSEAVQMAKESVQLSHPDDPFWEEICGLFEELKQLAPTP